MNQEPDTKTKILDAAEFLFALQGFDGTSLRDITSRAGVNLASVNYHFSSKEALHFAVIGRRIDAITQDRFRRLDALEAAHPDGPLPLDGVLDAFIRPMLQAAREHSDQVRPLMGRVYSEPGDRAAQFFMEFLRPTAERFLAALARALPGLPMSDLVWRFFFSVGAMTHFLMAGHIFGRFAAQFVQVDDPEEVIRQYVAYAAAGLRGGKESHAR
jgi:AcrR family transcriptional regulator